MIWAFYLSAFVYCFLPTSLLQLLSSSLLFPIHLVCYGLRAFAWLFLLPEMIFLWIATWLTCIPDVVCLNVSFLTRPTLKILFKITTPPPPPFSSLHACFVLLSTYHFLTYLTIYIFVSCLCPPHKNISWMWATIYTYASIFFHHSISCALYI